MMKKSEESRKLYLIGWFHDFSQSAIERNAEYTITRNVPRDV